MTVNTIAPPLLSGSERQQIQQLRDYLFAIHKQLATAMNNLDVSNFSEGTMAQIAAAAGNVGGVTREALSQQAATLKSLIVRTADVVYEEMDRLTVELESKYLAVSDFGEYAETVSTNITATAAAVEQMIQYYSEVQAAQGEVSAALQNYITRTEGYIRYGIVDWEGTVPLFGIAIGQAIETDGTYTVDGVAYDVIDKKNFLSIFTAKKLSFYQGETEVAYVSNEKLYITSANILGTIELGGKWRLEHGGGFSLKWIG